MPRSQYGYVPLSSAGSGAPSLMTRLSRDYQANLLFNPHRMATLVSAALTTVGALRTALSQPFPPLRLYLLTIIPPAAELEPPVDFRTPPYESHMGPARVNSEVQ